uniref:Uncharacterized protein n=1 Tax=Oryza rufipogon TaxID=4529 RepID=A0A0E0QFP9_ORYRU
MDAVRRMRRGLRYMKQIQPSNQHAVSAAEPGRGDQQPAQRRRERTWLPPNPWGRGRQPWRATRGGGQASRSARRRARRRREQAISVVEPPGALDATTSAISYPHLHSR